VLKNLSSALFWDYENVPLRNNDWELFMDALDYIIDEINFEFIRIYSREKTMSDRDYEILTDRGYSDENFKWVNSDESNAAEVDKDIQDKISRLCRFNQRCSINSK
jgi:hypothetical protein